MLGRCVSNQLAHDERQVHDNPASGSGAHESGADRVLPASGPLSSFDLASGTQLAYCKGLRTRRPTVNPQLGVGHRRAPCRTEETFPCRKWGPHGHVASDLPSLPSADRVCIRHPEARGDGAPEMSKSPQLARSSPSPASFVMAAMPARRPNPTPYRSVNAWPRRIRHVPCLNCGRAFQSDSKAQRLCKACRPGPRTGFRF